MNSNSFFFYGRSGKNIHASESVMIDAIDEKRGQAKIKQITYLSKATIFLYIS
jgi:hypothetical protein